MMKKSRKEMFKSLKNYNMVMSCIWEFITILVLGVLFGYLLEQHKTVKEINFMLISVIASIVIGIIVFFVSLLKGMKKMDNLNKKESNDDDQFLA